MRSHLVKISAAPSLIEAMLARSKTTSPTSVVSPTGLGRRPRRPRLEPRSRAVIRVFAPAPARATAVSRPIPEFPPVTITVLPVMSATSIDPILHCRAGEPASARGRAL